MVPLQFTAELQQGNLQQQEHKMSHTQKSQQVAAVATFIKGAREADFKSVASEQPNGMNCHSSSSSSNTFQLFSHI
ncbi:hypothetical protein ACLKA6_008200 [Drosophila palustris]